MDSKTDPVISLPSQARNIPSPPGGRILEVLTDAGILLRADCGGKGRCGKCAVRVVEKAADALAPPTENERRVLGENNIAAGLRLACQTEISGDIAIDIPEASTPSAEVSQKGPPLLPDPLPVRHAAPPFPGAHGVAVDLGTTTVAVYLCDLGEYRVTGSTAVRNPQIIYGDDVMSRISAVHRNPGRLGQLRKMVVGAIEWGVRSLCRSCRVDAHRIHRMVVVGNTTMIHLFLEEDPVSIGIYPYTPRFTEEKKFSAGSIGFEFNPVAEVVTLPLISGFLGSDILAAALAADLEAKAEGTVLVDVGTNGEVMLTGAGGLSATSCATGPAFEGAAIHHGMHAVSGAIDAVKIDGRSGKAHCSVIQKDPSRPKKPSGVCGSGVVSIAAELYRNGIVLDSGRFNRDRFAASFRTDQSGMAEYMIAEGSQTAGGQPITFTQRDVRAVQLAKGALSAGIRLLCREGGFDSPRRILVAGAFGSHIRMADALTIGMFGGIDLERLETIGNAAGSGAILALFDDAYRAKAASLAGSTKVLDLAGHPDFQETFLSALAFPAA